MKYRSCVVVMIGEETANRKRVRYEIEKAWNDGKELLEIYIHNLKDLVTDKCTQGKNPFTSFIIKENNKSLADIVKCYNPNLNDAYNDIKDNLEKWVEEAIKIRDNY